MRITLNIILTLFLFNCSQRNIEIISTDVSEDIVMPKHYLISKTSEEMVIDGLPTESSWIQAALTDNFIDIEGQKTPTYDTQVKMLWDDNYLYVYAKLNEPHVWGNITKRDAIIYHNNDFEVFIDPSGTGFRYGEIELNALNTVWDLYLNRPYRVGANPIFEWNLNDLKSAVHIDGTLNDPSDIDSFWAVEMAIPLKPYFRMVHGSKDNLLKNEQWRINFSRVQWDHEIVDGQYYRKKEDGKLLEEHNWVWSYMKTIDMHQPEKWGYIQFSEQTDNTPGKFLHDADLIIKQVAYALFRNTSRGDLGYLKKEKDKNHYKIKVKYSDDETLEAEFYRTNFGYEYTITSPLTNKTYVINNEGKLKTL
jgi:hypothetical protein